MTHRTEDLHTQRLVCLVLAATLAFAFQGGCGKKASSDKEKLTWKQFERALNLPKVTTVRELFAELQPERNEKFFKEHPDAYNPVNDFQAIEEYLSNFYQQAGYPNVVMTPELAKKMLIEDMTWLGDGVKAEHITRVHQVYTSRANRAEDLANWGNPVWFNLFTDDSGKILGWTKTK